MSWILEYFVVYLFCVYICSAGYVELSIVLLYLLRCLVYHMRSKTRSWSVRCGGHITSRLLAMRTTPDTLTRSLPAGLEYNRLPSTGVNAFIQTSAKHRRGGKNVAPISRFQPWLKLLRLIGWIGSDSQPWTFFLRHLGFICYFVPGYHVPGTIIFRFFFFEIVLCTRYQVRPKHNICAIFLTNASWENITKRDLPTGLLSFSIFITSMFTNRYITAFGTLPLSHDSRQNCDSIALIVWIAFYITVFAVRHCSFQWKSLFPPVDIQHTPYVPADSSSYREIQALSSLLY